MTFESATATELADFANIVLQDSEPLRLNGPARNEITLERQNGIESRLGAFTLLITKDVREYKKDGYIRQRIRNLFGERSWFDTRIRYTDNLDPEQTRRFMTQADLDSCYVVVGDNRNPQAVIRPPDPSDIAALNQAIAFITYEQINE